MPSTIVPVPAWARSETSRLTERFIRRKRAAGIAMARDSTLSTSESRSPSDSTSLLQPRLGDRLLLAVADDAGDPPPRPPGMHAIQVDEAHGLVHAVGVRHTGPQGAGHDREVRVGVLGLFRLLLVAQLGPPLHLVVLI